LGGRLGSKRFLGTTAVVTGGAGFIGSHLCDVLIAGGASVVCVDNLVGTRGSTRNIDHLLAEPAFTFVQDAVADWAAATDLTGVNWVFNQAASKNTVCMRDPEQDLIANGLSTLRLLLAAQRDGVEKFVQASTGSVYGESRGQQNEDHPRDPVSFYGVSKLCGDSYCRVVGELFDLDYTVLRYYHVIGPRQDDSETGGVVPIFVRNCLEGSEITIYGNGEQVRSFTSVRDVVEANLRVAELGLRTRGSFNCASGVRVTIEELARFIVAETGAEITIRYADWRPGDIVEFDVDSSKIQACGITFTKDWRSAVREVIDFKLEVLSRSKAFDFGARLAPALAVDPT
jgi:UDP-glucose 4-epimerase